MKWDYHATDRNGQVTQSVRELYGSDEQLATYCQALARDAERGHVKAMTVTFWDGSTAHFDRRES